MQHESPLIGILVIGLGLAFFFGIIANRLKISPLIGYLLAGIAVGPFTPGFVADQKLALELAEIGVMLLMFGVGLHFSVADLIAVRRIAVPGALVQVLCSVAMGFGAARLLGMSTGAGVVFGLALSVASTVVLLRTLQELRLIETERGRLAVGWLVIQDIVTVLALVLLPIVEPLLKPSGGATLDLSGLVMSVALTFGKVIAFMLLMLVVGRRFIPAFLHYVAQSGSRELFRLSLLALALGVAFIATEWFDISFALGAFVAGMVLSESELSHHAAEETLPLRDAFAVLFFISVGMLFNPAVLLDRPLPLLATLLVVMVGTPLVVVALLLAFRQSWTTILFMASGLAQIGEFSFILAALGIQMGVMNEAARDLILGVSILAILGNPFVVRLSEWLETRIADRSDAAGDGLHRVPDENRDFSTWQGHAVIVGFGRVGRFLAQGLHDAGFPFVIIEAGEHADADPAYRDVIISGNAVDPEVMKMTGLEGARLLAVAIPEPFEAGQIVEQARRIRSDLPIIVRAHFDSAVTHLAELGATKVVMGEREIAYAMLRFAEEMPPLPESTPAAAAS